MIRYTKLFEILNQQGMQLSDLRKIISSATVAKLKKGEYISGEVIEKICLFLDCQPGDIMEVVKEDDEKNTKYIKFVRKMSEPIYKMIKAEAKKQDISIKEQWEKYLEFASDKQKKDEDFEIIKAYMEERIKEDEEQ